MLVKRLRVGVYTVFHAADQIRACHQPEDREGNWPRSAADVFARADEVIE
jgi:hypothetical protein